METEKDEAASDTKMASSPPDEVRPLWEKVGAAGALHSSTKWQVVSVTALVFVLLIATFASKAILCAFVF